MLMLKYCHRRSVVSLERVILTLQVRNVAVVGHLHHGKTTVMDMLVEQTHDVKHEWRANEKQLKFTDTRVDEQARQISLKMMPMSLVMENTAGKVRATRS